MLTDDQYEHLAATLARQGERGAARAVYEALRDAPGISMWFVPDGFYGTDYPNPWEDD